MRRALVLLGLLGMLAGCAQTGAQQGSQYDSLYRDTTMIGGAGGGGGGGGGGM